MKKGDSHQQKKSFQVFFVVGSIFLLLDLWIYIYCKYCTSLTVSVGLNV